MKEIRKYIKDNFANILAIIPVLWILMQGIILSNFWMIAFFSFEHIFVDTFYMILILLLWIATFSYRVYPFLNNKYELKNVGRWLLISLWLALVFIAMKSKPFMLILIMNLFVWILINLNYLIKQQYKDNAKRSFWYLLIIWSFFMNILCFNLVMFDGIYDKETNLRVIYLNDKYVLLENKTIVGNNDRIFFLSWSSIKIPFMD